MRSIHTWLDHYAQDHQNPTNKRIHWVCVPLIVWSLMALLWAAPFPFSVSLYSIPLNWAFVLFIAGSLYYLALSWRLAIGLMLLNALFLYFCYLAQEHLPWSLWITATGIFVAAWIGQFVGHKIEGRRPSFFTDLQFLMIGPAWVIAFAYRRVGLKF